MPKLTSEQKEKMLGSIAKEGKKGTLAWRKKNLPEKEKDIFDKIYGYATGGAKKKSNNYRKGEN